MSDLPPSQQFALECIFDNGFRYVGKDEEDVIVVFNGIATKMEARILPNGDIKYKKLEHKETK